MPGSVSKWLPDDLWERVHPLLPKPRRRRSRYPGRKPLNDRAVLTGIIFVLRTGIPWREMPAELGCGSGMTCLRRLKRWYRNGVFQKLYEVLLAELHGADKLDWSRALVDSATTKAPSGGEKTGPNPTDRRKLRLEGTRAGRCQGHSTGDPGERRQHPRCHPGDPAGGWGAEGSGEKTAGHNKDRTGCKGIEAMTPSHSGINSDAVGSSHNSRNGGPSMALGSARRAGMSREPWPGSSAMGRLGSALRGGPRTTKRSSNWQPASSAIETYEVILLRALSYLQRALLLFTLIGFRCEGDSLLHHAAGRFCTQPL